MAGEEIPLALGGGILCSADQLRDRMLANIRTEHGRRIAAVTLVPQPVRGAIALAQPARSAGE
jgi:hypothetical protein